MMALRPLAPFAFALALAACGPLTSSDDQLTPPDPMTQLHVDRVRVQYATAFAPRSAELPYGEALRLETFLDQAGLRPDDRVYIASPTEDGLALQRIERIKALLERRGVGAVPIAPPANIEPDHIVVLADRYVVTPPACPQWSEAAATGHSNVPSSNFGCSTANNFALMIDNPRDLMTGRRLGPADAEPTIESVERYRTDQVKPFLSGGASTSSAAATQGSSSSGSGGSGSSSVSPSASGAGGAAATAATAAGGMAGSGGGGGGGQ
jgi:pilus assembly protein CpaD